MRQKGSAKLCALEFDPKDLEYKPAAMVPDPETGDEVEVSRWTTPMEFGRSLMLGRTWLEGPTSVESYASDST